MCSCVLLPVHPNQSWPLALKKVFLRSPNKGLLTCCMCLLCFFPVKTFILTRMFWQGQCRIACTVRFLSFVSPLLLLCFFCLFVLTGNTRLCVSA